ncbi:MAG: ComF family protein [Bacillus sp. (in: Bacteria)]|nr:ComF family protein [Bacillus sp. (in: firmicutes)]MCM1425244.1 ComF family protein [Eubacterium sp.]
MKNPFKFFYGMLLDLVYPRRCPVCDKAVKPFGSLICEECTKKIKYVNAPYCQKCGKELKDKRAFFCHDCAHKEHKYDKGMALFSYPDVADSIYRFKYQKRQEYAAYYAERMACVLGEKILALHPDALVPVPIHPAKKRARGYNQAQVLAEELGRILDIPVNAKIIKRVRKTIPMKELSVTQRQNNLKKAFKISHNDVKLSTIVIIDDIYTTGSTIDAMAHELRQAGIKHIYFATLAIGNGI